MQSPGACCNLSLEKSLKKDVTSPRDHQAIQIQQSIASKTVNIMSPNCMHHKFDAVDSTSRALKASWNVIDSNRQMSMLNLYWPIATIGNSTCLWLNLHGNHLDRLRWLNRLEHGRYRDGRSQRRGWQYCGVHL
jgi:hypothetical protein